MLSQADQERVSAAVAKAEAATSGELICVLTEEVSGYPEVPLAWSAAAAILLPPVALALGLRPDRIAPEIWGWTAAHGGEALGRVLTAYTLLQIAVLAVFAGLLAIPSVRRRLTPRGLKAARVREAAERSFAGARLHLAPGQPAVMIFAALAERRIEVLADETIHAKVGPAAWDHAVAQALAAIRADGPAAGLVRAVEVCGETLASHFPDDGGGNRFPDRALVL
jgi:putative membrane protein